MPILLILSFMLLSPILHAEQQTITLIHLNDLHAHLTPHYTLTDDQQTGEASITKRGGLARIATTIKQIRQQNPNSVLMNIGDTYHGGVEALYTQGNAIVDPVNALNIDVGVPGNWDFAYGPIVTRARYADRGLLSKLKNIKRPNFPNLAANVTYSQPFWLKDKPFLAPTFSKTIQNINISFIGLTSDIVPKMHDKLAIGLNFAQGEAAYLDLLQTRAKQLREQGADIVIVMSELGLQKDYHLANQLPSNTIDVFFSAHTHETTFEALKSGSGALVVESGDDTYLGRMDLVINEGKIINHHWQLLPITQDITPDPAMLALVKKARAPFLETDVNLTTSLMQGQHKLTQPINTVVGHSHLPLHRKNSLESPFNNAITDMLRQYSQTDIAMSKGFRFGSIIPAAGYELEDNNIAVGDITLEDVYRFFPAIYQYATAEVSGQRLKEIVEEGLTQVYSADIFKQYGGWFEGYSGLNMELDLASPDGQRVLALHLSDTNQEITDSQMLTVTGCIRPLDKNTLCAFNGFENVTPLVNPETGEAWNNIDFFLQALQQNTLPTTNRQNIIDQNNTPLWPQTPYVQPLTGVSFD